MTDALLPSPGVQAETQCDAFEEAWQRASNLEQRPRIETYLPAVVASARPKLVHDLLAMELEYREKANEPFTLAEYCARLPEYQATVAALFAQRFPVPECYELLGFLGRGGMGVVYKAHHLTLQRTVALKMIRSGTSAGREELVRFRTEAAATARLQHENIVQVFEVAHHEGLPYCALEFVEGGTLAQKLQREPLSYRAAAELVQTLARAMHVAHSRNIVHRDLKPCNVLLFHGDIPKITDFGLARMLDTDSRETLAGRVMGTPAYMAPEQAAGRAHEAGPAADVYALGAILYEMLTGQVPFTGATVPATLEAVRTQEPLPPSRARRGVPFDLETICLKCLHKDAAKRYASALELAEDLARWQRDEPILARSVGRLERLWKWAKRRPVWAAVAGVAAALGSVIAYLAVSLSFQLHATTQAKEQAERKEREANEQRVEANERRLEANDQRQVADGQRRVAEDQTLRLTALQGEAHLRAGDLFPALLYFADAAGRAAERAPPVLGPQQQLHAALREAPHLAQLWTHTAAVTHVEFDRAGQAVVIAYRDGTARVCDAQTGKERFAALRHDRPISRATFSADGTLLATGCDEGLVRIWNATTGASCGEPIKFTEPVVHVAFEPGAGARVVAVTGNRFERAYTEQRPGAPQMRMVPGPPGPNGTPTWTPQYTPGTPQTINHRPRGLARIWDATQGKPTARPLFLPGWIEHAAFSADGQFLAVAGGNEDSRSPVQVWATATGEKVGPLLLHERHVHCVAFSPDAAHLVTASGHPGHDRGEAQVWDVRTGQRVGRPLRHGGAVVTAAYSPDGHRIVTAGLDGMAQVWDARSGDPLTPGMRLAGPLAGAWFSPDGQFVLTASLGGTARVWDAPTGAPRSPLLRHNGPVVSAAFAADSHRLVTGSADGTVRLWDLATWAGPAYYLREVVLPPVRSSSSMQIHGPTGVIQWVRATQGELLATAAHVSATGRLLTFAGTHVQDIVAGGGRSFGGVEVQPFAACLWDANGTLKRRWPADLSDPATGRAGDGARLAPPLARPYHMPWFEHAPQLSPDGARLALLTEQRAVSLWDLAQDKMLVERPLEAGVELQALAFAQEGPCYLAGLSEKLVAGKPVRKLLVREVESGAEIASLDLPAQLETVALSPEGRLLVTVLLRKGANGPEWVAQVWRWGADGLTRVGRERVHDRPVRRVALNAAGDRLLAYSAEPSRLALTVAAVRDCVPTYHAWLWDVHADPGEPLRLGHTDVVLGAEFDPAGKQIVTRSADGTARVWSAQDGKPVTPALVHRSRVHHAAFGPDGLLATASGDRTACLWQLPTGERIGAPVQHREEVLHVQFASVAGRRVLLTACADGVVRHWDLASAARTPGDLRHLAELLSGQRLDPLVGVVPLERAELERLWDTLRPGLGRTPSTALVWHRDEADAAERRADWTAAASHLERLALAEPRQGGLRVRLARALARLGRWSEAEASYRTARDLGESEPMLWYLGAVLQVQTGQLEEYRRTCAEMLARFGQTDDARLAGLVARTCVLGPDAVADFVPVLQLAAQASGTGQGSTFAAALYRAGQFADAIEAVTPAGKALPQPPHPWDGYILALAHARLDRATVAARHLEGASGRLAEEARLLAERGREGPPWADRLPLHLLRQEAEARLQAPPP